MIVLLQAGPITRPITKLNREPLHGTHTCSGKEQTPQICCWNQTSRSSDSKSRIIKLNHQVANWDNVAAESQKCATVP